MNIVEFEVVKPVLVRDYHSTIGLPEGSTLAFDGEGVYVKSHAGIYKVMLTERRFILQWVRDGAIKRKLLPKNQATEEIKRAYTPREQAPKPAPPVIPLGPGEFPQDSSLLPALSDYPYC